MKICYLADAGSIHVKRHAGYFAQSGKHEVHIISFEKEKVNKNIHFHFVEPKIKYSYFLNLLANIRKIKTILRDIAPDLLHAIFVTNYGFLGACSGFRPFVVSCIGSDILIKPKKSVLNKWLTVYTLKNADIITSVSNFITGNVIKLGADSQKVRTFPFGVDLNEFYPDESERRVDNGALLCLRGFKPVYNIEMLLKAIAHLKKERSAFKLTLAGDGPDKTKLIQMAQSLGILDVVDFVGAIDHSKVPERLWNSSIYLSTSLSDGASISLMEAMACGCFPIVTDIPANRDWITDGLNGFLIPVDDHLLLADRIKEAMDNVALRKKAAQKNIEIIRTAGSWHKDMEKLTSIYDFLIESSSSKSV